MLADGHRRKSLPAAHRLSLLTESRINLQSLFWGTTAQTNETATPIGWSTSASAPNDRSGHGILAVRATTSHTLWGAFDCSDIGIPTSGSPGGGMSSGHAAPKPGLVNFFGAIADPDSNLCLTASFSDLQNMTITRATCINSLDVVPDPTQAWQWNVFADEFVLVPNVLDQLVFIGPQATSTVFTMTNYVPTLVGTGVGAFVALEQDVGGLNPADAATVPGLLVSFRKFGWVQEMSGS
ncbi:hypothetical protein B0H19DRAFT_1349824 [Mycena capillaripes]|nr:hypothetical protein B0H19DRAFT_1349824 [Mycena capillaripes]